MAAFLSTFANKVDRKGRVSVPASFRSVLERAPPGRHLPGGTGIQIALFASYKHDCIEGCGDQRFGEIFDAVNARDDQSNESENLKHVMSEMSQLSIDSDGRIIIPQNLRDHAGIGEMATFAGIGKSFQIWTPEGFEAHRKEIRARVREDGLQLRISPIASGDG